MHVVGNTSVHCRGYEENVSVDCCWKSLKSSVPESLPGGAPCALFILLGHVRGRVGSWRTLVSECELCLCLPLVSSWGELLSFPKILFCYL